MTRVMHWKMKSFTRVVPEAAVFAGIDRSVIVFATQPANRAISAKASLKFGEELWANLIAAISFDLPQDTFFHVVLK